MSRLEKTTPHAYLLAKTGRELFGRGSPAELRLALVVLDGLTEMLLRLNTAEQEVWLDLGAAAARANRDLEEVGHEYRLDVHALQFPVDVTKADLPGVHSVYLSRTQKKKLYEFEPNVDVAVFFGTISKEDGGALKALHHYRNRAYHHNDARPGTLTGLVEVQLTVLANLARSIRPTLSGPVYSSRQASPQTPTLAEIATVLDTSIHIHGSQLVESLQNALLAQLAGLDGRLTEIREFINGSLPLVTETDVLRLVQLPEPWPDIQEARRATVGVTPEVLSSWRESANSLASTEDARLAVADYFSIDKPLTLLMEAVVPFTDQIDREIDRAIDERRGR